MRSSTILGLALLTVSLTLGCSSDSGDDAGSQKAADAKTRFVIATAVSSDTDANSYVRVMSEYEDELDLSTAREFPGWSDLNAIGKYVFVSSGEAPVVWRYTVAADGTLEGGGLRDTIDFGEHTGDANFYNQTLISETKAYLIGEDGYVVWNPTTLEIERTIPFPELPERDGIPAYYGLDHSSVLRDGRLYASAGWGDTDNLKFFPDSRIVVIDTAVDEVVDVLDVPCPDLSAADRDEEGNLYFSNWVYSPGGTLLADGPATCAVRIPAGSEQIDRDWTFTYADVDGHEGSNLGYLGQGKWLYTSFTNTLDNYDPNEDRFGWLFGDHWQLRTLDTKTLGTAPVEGAPLNGGGYFSGRLDGTTHVLLPGDAYTTTTMYAIGSDGQATEKMHMSGWSTRMVQLP